MATIDYIKADKNMIEKSTLIFSKENDDLELLLEKERKIYTKDFNELIGTLKSNVIPKLHELQGDVLVLSDELSNKITSHLSSFAKYRVKYKKSEADRFEYYSGFNTGAAYKLKVADSKKSLLINRDLSENQRRSEIYELHIDHLRELRKRCNDVQFALKNRIELMNISERIS